MAKEGADHIYAKLDVRDFFAYFMPGFLCLIGCTLATIMYISDFDPVKTKHNLIEIEYFFFPPSVRGAVQVQNVSQIKSTVSQNIRPNSDILLHSNQSQGGYFISRTFMLVSGIMVISYILGHVVNSISVFILELPIIGRTVSYPHDAFINKTGLINKGILFENSNKKIVLYITVLFIALIHYLFSISTLLSHVVCNIIHMHSTSFFIITIITLLSVFCLIVILTIEYLKVKYRDWTLIDRTLSDELASIIPQLTDINRVLKNERNDIFWILYWKISKTDATLFNILEKWRTLYASVRSISMAFSIISNILSTLFIAYVVSNNVQNINYIFIFIVLILNFIFIILTLRAYYLYYNIFSRSTYRMILALKSSEIKPNTSLLY